MEPTKEGLTTQQQEDALKVKYPDAYKEVMSNPIQLLWKSQTIAMKEEILKGTQSNIEFRRCK